MSKVEELDVMIEVPESDWEGMIEDIEECALSIRTLRRRLREAGLNYEVTDEDQAAQLQWEELNSVELVVDDGSNLN